MPATSSKPVTRQEVMAMLLRGVAEDVAAYRGLQDLLDQQFDAIVRHQTARLTSIGETILPALQAMDARRRQRVGLVASLLGPDAGMDQVVNLLKGASRATLESNWAELEQMVVDCKRRNIRNSTLLTDQYTIMQRVLHGEDQIYAPL